jgi:hypothetical protein
MDVLKHAKAELNAAERSLQSMMTARDFEHFEEEWRSFLNHIEKVWIKSERACQHIMEKFQPWQGKFSRLRKKDMLLRYLKQARDADNHSIQEVMKVVPGEYSFTIPGGPGVVHIDSLKIKNGRVVEYKGSHPATEKITLPQIKAVSVKNSGKWYNPPTSHLSVAIQTNNPIQIAKQGIEFYKNYIIKIEDKFFK